MRRMVGLIGYARTGKDVLGAEFVRLGWSRRTPGDVIKALFDPMVQGILGYSAFTEVPHEKERIRSLLVHGGRTFYDEVMRRHEANLDRDEALGLSVINTRLYHPEEIEAWRARGGDVWEIVRPGVGPTDETEERNYAEVRQRGWVDGVIMNDSTLDEWITRARALAEMQDWLWLAGGGR